VRHNKLPKVSWIVSPEAFSEHGNWPANYGAWYISQVLDALTSNPQLWSKTALLITYGENDGFFEASRPADPAPACTFLDQGFSLRATARALHVPHMAVRRALAELPLKA
jgi:phospholipase C